jgi:hypothetical protein
MSNPFDTWLQELAAANKGGSSITSGIIPPAVRGDKWQTVLELPGDWSTATIAGVIRNTPDAGSALATMTVTGGTYDSGTNTTRFTASLAAGSGTNSTGGLPSDDDGNGVVRFPAAFTITPSGGTAELLFGFAFVLLGKV